ncbi:MAG: BCCT family transporter [Peptostreptococcaceae bacterium]
MAKKSINFVFLISLGLALLVVILGIFIPTEFSVIVNSLLNVMIENFSWYYIILMFVIFIFCIYLAFSKYGNIKLGKDDDKPEFSNITWFAMLFGAGMGIGLVFYGASEPLKHFVSPLNIESGSREALVFSIKQSFVHWGFQPWAAYSIIGLSLAYFQFRKDKPGLISSTLFPILKDKKYKSQIANIIDILSVFATITGVAASFGIGTLQIAGGIEFVFGIKSTLIVQIIIITIITIIYTGTAVSGINNGMKNLSNINLMLAVFLLISSFIIGPTLNIIGAFVNGLGTYINEFISTTLYIDPSGNNKWLGEWRVFYWAFWIAWTPFVGIFIARISKGRTVKEFILGVTILPAIVSLFWFSVFGMMGMDLGLEFAKDAVITTENTLFKVFSNYEFGKLLSSIAIVLLFTFFITSANSSTYVLSMFTSKGDLNPGKNKKILWGVIQSLFALALIMSGGINILQNISIIVAFPFSIIIIFMMISILKEFKSEVNTLEGNKHKAVSKGVK